MALSPDVEDLFAKHKKLAEDLAPKDELMLKHYKGVQELTHLGLAVPPDLRQFVAVLNWNRLTVDTIAQRQMVKSFILPGQVDADEALQENWAANNLDSESRLLHKDVLIYGRGFVCVGSNEEDLEHPLITVESPRELTAIINPRSRRISSALRLHGGTDDAPDPVLATLYLPDSTAWFEKIEGTWTETDRDDHGLGRVPIVMFLNRRLTGEWAGESEMTDVIPHVDIVSRQLLNMQVAGETIAIPKRWATAMSKGDFVDSAGKQLPVWEAYMGAIWASGNKDAKFGQFDGADLKNFHDTIAMEAGLVSSVTGLPLRYLGQNSVNPASGDAIRADEYRLILNTSDKNSTIGDGWAWVQGIAQRFRTGEWPLANQIKTEWHDPGMLTFSQMADGISKLNGGTAVLSREGSWDELGWSEARKDRERGYIKSEDEDPYFSDQVAKDVVANGAAVPAPVGDGVRELSA